jgi:D-3-phosphoglycerate dehydrogenase
VIVSRHLDKPALSGVPPLSFWKCTINIAGMQVGRVQPFEHAIMVLNVDSEVPAEVMEEIHGMPGIFTATFA